jgi:hypothetical protein
MDSQNPQLAATWGIVGGNSFGQCLPDGPFANLIVQRPNRHCVSRNFALGRVLPSPEAMTLVTTLTTFNTFRQGLEGGLHATVHNWIGGDMQYMFSNTKALFQVWIKSVKF